MRVPGRWQLNIKKPLQRMNGFIGSSSSGGLTLGPKIRIVFENPGKKCSLSNLLIA
jgi:hypothetical protein